MKDFMCLRRTTWHENERPRGAWGMQAPLWYKHQGGRGLGGRGRLWWQRSCMKDWPALR